MSDILVYYLQEIARDILEQQSPKQVHVVRSKLYELLVNCLPPELILRTMSQELMNKLDDQLKHKCSAAAAQYEHRLQVCHVTFLFKTACPSIQAATCRAGL